MLLVFAGDHYYPSGGWDDFQGAFSSLEEAAENIEPGKKNYNKYKIGHRFYDWYHIVDANTLKVVEYGG